VDDEHAGPARELDHPIEEPGGCDRARRVVGVVDEEQLGPLEDGIGDGVEVGREAAVGQQRQRIRLGADEERSAGVDRVAGVRGEGDVARVN
jgi:hypothetical protein